MPDISDNVVTLSFLLSEYLMSFALSHRPSEMITSRVLAKDQIDLSGEEERDSSGFVNKLKEFTAFAWGLGMK